MDEGKTPPALGNVVNAREGSTPREATLREARSPDATVASEAHPAESDPIGAILRERRGWQAPPPSRGLAFIAVVFVLIAGATVGAFLLLSPKAMPRVSDTTTAAARSDVPAASPTVESTEPIIVTTGDQADAGADASAAKSAVRPSRPLAKRGSHAAPHRAPRKVTHAKPAKARSRVAEDDLFATPHGEPAKKKR